MWSPVTGSLGDKDKGSSGNKGKGEGKSENNATLAEGKGHIGVNGRHTWTNSIDIEGDQGSSWESEPEEEKPEELASLEAPDDEEKGVGPNGTALGAESKRIKGQQFTTLQETTKKSSHLENCTIWSNETQEPSGHGRRSPWWSTQEQRRT